MQALVTPALEKLARNTASDPAKRHLLMTDRLTVTASVTSTNFDYYADLSTIMTTYGVMKDFLQQGTIYHTYTAKTFTADATTDRLSAASHGFPTGLKVRVSTSGTLPAGLTASTDYYVIATGASVFQLATSRANAFAGTAIDITDAGSGTHTCTAWEQDRLQWGTVQSAGLTNGLPVSYIYGWLVGDKLFTTVQSGTFSFTVPFIPTISTLPAKLENSLIDQMVELALGGKADEQS